MKKFTILIIVLCFMASCTTVKENSVTTAQENTMIRINGGTFTMGSPANEAGRDSDEIQRQVTVSSFQMSRYPVTQREYQEIMGTNPSHFKGDNLPVERISWWDAVEYCNRRSHREGLTLAYLIDRERNTITWNRNATGYRLPTEAEWEYACRAGTTTPWNTGNSITSDQANFEADFEGFNPYKIETTTEWGTTTPVGSFLANAWGLHDMHGNVWELCWDWYGDYATGAQNNPIGPSAGTVRVLRGGSWCDYAGSARSASRGGCSPSYGGNGLGFRVVRDLDMQDALNEAIEAVNRVNEALRTFGF